MAAIQTNECCLTSACAEDVFWRPRLLPGYASYWICAVEFPPTGPALLFPLDFRWWWYNGFFKIAFLGWLNVLLIKMDQKHIAAIINPVCRSWCLVCIFLLFFKQTSLFIMAVNEGKKRVFRPHGNFSLQYCECPSGRAAIRLSGLRFLRKERINLQSFLLF